LAVVKALAQYRGDLHTLLDTGATPIFMASQNGHMAVAKLLAEHGADLNIPTNNGATPVCIAAQNGALNI
jgi:ankyrin repeat protein